MRQAGGLSFARVFQAAHAVPYSQAATAAAIFERVVGGRDVATGTRGDGGYVSEGGNSAWSESAVPGEQGRAKCYLWDVLETCTVDEEGVLYSGRAVVRDYILVGVEGGNGTSGTGLER